MPLYEYQCEVCGVRFERMQRMSDDPVKTCPECCGSVRRLIQPVGIIFKGSGFYVTDNRSKTASSRTQSGEKSTSKSSESERPSKSENSSESKSSSDKSGSSGSSEKP